MDEDRLFDKLDTLDEQNRQLLVNLTSLQEQIKLVPDHENRIRVLERWKYGLPLAGLTAVLSAGVSAWTASKGA